MMRIFFKQSIRRAGSGLVLLAASLLISGIRAQQAGPPEGNRWLLIFDTSSGMKQRLPETQAEINNLLAQGMGGRLHPGDSIGVWTFDKTPHVGQFPLQFWAPEHAASIATAINKFIGGQRYASAARFDALMPVLNQVVRDSGRLTVLIFCDGTGAITNTPYDGGINLLFQQRQAQQKKARQPFVLVLRSQLGHYTGCTVNFPPGMVNLPDFPPPPPPPAPLVTNTVVPTIPPPVITPPTPRIGTPLVIIGTNIGTTWPPPPTPKPEPVVETNAAPAPPALRVTNPIDPAYPPPPTNPMTPVEPANPPVAGESVEATNVVFPPTPMPVPITNTATATNRVETAPFPGPFTNAAAEPDRIEPATAVARTNKIVEPDGNSSSGHAGALILGVGLLVAAGALATFAFSRARRTGRGSLITRSMRKD